jgi:hypothetical protein
VTQPTYPLPFYPFYYIFSFTQLFYFSIRPTFPFPSFIFSIIYSSKYFPFFKELIFNTLLFANDQHIIANTEDNLQRAVYLLYSISKEYNLEIATGKTKVFGFVGTDHLRAKVIINDETLDQVNQFMYLGCSISYQFSNDVEFKLA